MELKYGGHGGERRKGTEIRETRAGSRIKRTPR